MIKTSLNFIDTRERNIVMLILKDTGKMLEKKTYPKKNLLHYNFLEKVRTL